MTALQLPLQVTQRSRPWTIIERFGAYCEKHPEVEGMIIEIARDLQSRGHKTYSMDAIFHRLRWHYRIERDVGDFKLNDHFTAMYARKLEAEYAEFAGFFELRKRKAI